MIILITGATHTGKTRMAQKLMELLRIPYVCQDHIKMGLIRSGNTPLTPEDDRKLTDYLWPITREIIKTAIENKQNLITEGCYMPFDLRKDFTEEYLREISYICLVFSEGYIRKHYEDIVKYGSVIESRLDDGYVTEELLLRENGRYLEGCRSFGLPYLLINEDYEKETARVQDMLKNLP